MLDKILDGLDYVAAILKKALSFLMDRRFWAVALLTALLAVPQLFGLEKATTELVLGSFGDLLTGAEELIVALVAVVAAVTKIATAGVAIITLIVSWTKRAPSGLEEFRNRK